MWIALASFGPLGATMPYALQYENVAARARLPLALCDPLGLSEFSDSGKDAGAGCGHGC